MPVVVDRGAILHHWGDDGGSKIGVRSEAPVETLLEITDVNVRRHTQDPHLGEEFLEIYSWATPQGVAIDMADCYDPEDILAVVDQVAFRLEAAGFGAHIGPLISADHPQLHYLKSDGYSASMCLIG